MQSRRQFIVSLAGAGAGAAAALARSAGAMQTPQTTQTMFGPMEQDAYREVKRPPRAGAQPSMTDEERDALEHRIKCQCGCVLDVFTCRTTDFSCAVSPAMHSDVMGLVAGGYTAAEIIAAFREVYGERVLMSPPREGFNWLGYIMPFAALIAGGVVVAALIRRWRARAALEPRPAAVQVDATKDELDALEAAVRDDS